MFHPKFNKAESLLVASVLPFENLTASSNDGAVKNNDFINTKIFIYARITYGDHPRMEPMRWKHYCYSEKEN